MAWCQTSDKPLSEPVMAQFIDALICIIRPERVNKIIDRQRIFYKNMPKLNQHLKAV